MPKADLSGAGRILNFFNTAELGQADLVLQLCRDAVLVRKRAARDAAAAPTPTAAAPKAVAKKKRSHHKKRAPVQQTLPEVTEDPAAAAVPVPETEVPVPA